MSDPSNSIYRLAELYGVQPSYYDVYQNRDVSSEDSLVVILQALGAPVKDTENIDDAIRQRVEEKWRRPLESTVVAWNGETPPIKIKLPAGLAEKPVSGRLQLETGQESRLEWKDPPVLETAEVEGSRFVEKELRITPVLPFGYHRFILESPVHGQSLVISAPVKSYTPPDEERTWGVFCPVYSMHTGRSWGSGDLTDLQAFMEWVGSKGGKSVSTLPLLPGFFGVPFDPSPYSPVTRLLWNEFYIDIRAIPELDQCRKARSLLASGPVQAEIKALKELPEIDYCREMVLKRKILEELSRWIYAKPSQWLEELERFAAETPAAAEYAAFRATLEKQHTGWQSWPETLRAGKLQADDYDEEKRRYYLYAQWTAHRQVEAVTKRAGEKGIGLHLDLPLGVSPDGYDAWRWQDIFAGKASTGAPPDSFFTLGQDWSSPPLHPEKLRDSGYEYYIACLRHHLENAAALRIDHVMGFHRLFWIPRGLQARKGLYVNYNAPDFYAILSIESHRHKAIIIGEDLGNVPPEVRPAMAEHRLHRSYVVQYEMTPDSEICIGPVPQDAVATVNTHDMPPFAAYWQGLEIERSLKMGLLKQKDLKPAMESRESLRKALVHFLGRQGYDIPSAADIAAVHRAIVSFLASSPAREVIVNVEDLWQETEQQNVPGTTVEFPNWRRKTRYPLEEIKQLSQASETLALLDRFRKGADSFTMEREKMTEVTNEVTLLSEDDLYLFNQGSHFRIYEKLGAHPLTVNGIDGTYFAVWAPNAEKVTVVSGFNKWDRDAFPLRPRGTSGIWEGFIPGLTEGALYKYHISSRYNNYRVDKADPYAFFSEVSPRTASIVHRLNYNWSDHEWMGERKDRNKIKAPISIYEVHLGSWRRVVEEGHRFLTYRELAPQLAEHVKKMGFTHVEFMPVMEHPFYGSWGYQVTGYFAPTSRYGSPQDFMYLVDYLHQQGIGVILDWVPSHFPNDEHGLGFFDGTHLYEHADSRKGLHPDWNSLIFNYGRSEVQSFLISSALFWLDKYHVDGLRVDAVASMLYLDYSRKEGEWVSNKYGGKENIEAIDFLRRFNQEVYRSYPDVETIAEESTAWPMVSRPTYVGGLGFGLKWDMGWMHDILEYVSKGPVHRKYHHNLLTFRMIYAYTENFILPLSHDEVVHGKSSLVGRMPGDDWQKFANLRLLFCYMFGQVGKKLLFMGGEFGQWREWYHEESLDWHLLKYEPHQKLSRLVADLNRIYRAEPALYELDCAPGGFEWIDCNDAEQSVLAFIRRGSTTRTHILVVANFTPVIRYNYRVGVPYGGFWKELINSDASDYGGSGVGNLGGVVAEEMPHHGRPHSVNLTLPPLAAVFLVNQGE